MKCLGYIIITTVLTCVLTTGIAGAADNTASGDSSVASAAGDSAASADDIQVTFTQVYESARYHFRIPVVARPSVLPASLFFGDDSLRGEVLIFDNEGYDVKLAWVVLVDAFDDAYLPDLSKLTDEETDALLKKIREERAYDGVASVSLGDGRRALYALTARELEMDTDGDGKMDTFAEANGQMALTFFRTPKGGRYQVGLINNPELLRQNIAAYQVAVASFQDDYE